MNTKSGNISKSYVLDYVVVMLVVVIVLLFISLIVSLTSTSKAMKDIDKLIPYTPNAQTISVPTISSDKAKSKITEIANLFTANNTEFKSNELYKEYLKQNIVYSKGIFWTDIVIYYSVDSEKMIHLYYKNIKEYENLKNQLTKAGFLMEDLEIDIDVDTTESNIN